MHPVLAGPSAAPLQDEQVTTLDVVETDRPWDVIVWDDPVNLMSYVVFVFRRVFHFSEAVARKLMLEVHHDGRALVASEARERAEMYVQQLHGYGLHATMQRAG
jgi:ATP-dependent Clp protease adaptor protein ClpS